MLVMLVCYDAYILGLGLNVLVFYIVHYMYIHMYIIIQCALVYVQQHIPTAINIGDWGSWATPDVQGSHLAHA